MGTFYKPFHDAGEGTRTPTPSQETDFESVASAIPPHRQVCFTYLLTDRIPYITKDGAP